ncbi:MAG: hypothetical protein KDB14_33580 [Planctomycetales bacterium]|nr:hypothetical protein [Planctomycetales bacterium]
MNHRIAIVGSALSGIAIAAALIQLQPQSVVKPLATPSATAPRLLPSDRSGAGDQDPARCEPARTGQPSHVHPEDTADARLATSWPEAANVSPSQFTAPTGTIAPALESAADAGAAARSAPEPLATPTPAAPATWEPLMSMQMQQLNDTLRRLDDRAQSQQQLIHGMADELRDQRRQQWELQQAQRLATTPAPLPPAPPAPTAPPAQYLDSTTTPPLELAQAAPPKIKFGEEGDDSLTVNVQDADIRDVLDLLSQHTERNIVPLPSVQGKVTAFLKGVTLDEALDAILTSKGWVAKREPKFIYIGSASDFKKVKLEEEEAEEKKEMRTRVYRPNYISAVELQQLITPLLTVGTGQAAVAGEGEQQAAPAGGGDVFGFGAIAGAVKSVGAGAANGGVAGVAGAANGGMPLRVATTSPTVSGLESGSSATGGLDYAGSDVVLVRDYEEVLNQIDQVVLELDRRPRQVAIEAMILTVRLSDNMRLGVNFEMLRNQNTVRLVSGSPLDNLANIATAPGTLKFGYLDSSITSLIEALENVGETDIVASPRLMCLNKQQAEILIGAELGFVNTTVTQTAATQAVEFLEVGTQLRFRPFITDDDIVRLELQPELSTGTVRIEQGLTLPDKEVTKVTTNIICRNGATVIIGGLIREDLTTSVSQLPVLGSMPYLGPAFRRKTQAIDRRELIVLITPRVVNEDETHCEGVEAQREFLDRQDLYRDKLSPLGKRQIGLRYLRQARSAWSAGDCDNAFRFCNLALHYNPNDIEMLRLRQEIVAANPHLDVPLRNRVREGLRPGERPHVNYPREGVPWQKPAPVISPDDMLPPLPSRPGSIKRLDP